MRSTISAEPPDDADLVRIARAGGEVGRTAFGELVRRYQVWLLGYLVHLLGIRAIAEEVLQEVLVHAYRHLATLREDGAFRGWLRQIATRFAFNQRRGTKRRRGYEERAPPPAGEPSLAGRMEARDALLRVLAQLPYPSREILVLRHVEELPVSEIAANLGISSSAAKMRLARARTQFYAAWDEVTDAT